MESNIQITQKRYQLQDALNKIPTGMYNTVVEDVMGILGIKTRQQLLAYRKGTSMPTLAKAKAIEEYFLRNWNIENAWCEIQ